MFYGVWPPQPRPGQPGGGGAVPADWAASASPSSLSPASLLAVSAPRRASSPA